MLGPAALGRETTLFDYGRYLWHIARLEFETLYDERDARYDVLVLRLYVVDKEKGQRIPGVDIKSGSVKKLLPSLCKLNAPWAVMVLHLALGSDDEKLPWMKGIAEPEVVARYYLANHPPGAPDIGLQQGKVIAFKFRVSAHGDMLVTEQWLLSVQEDKIPIDMPLGQLLNFCKRRSCIRLTGLKRLLKSQDESCPEQKTARWMRGSFTNKELAQMWST